LRILIDESLPIALALEFVGHDITADKALRSQQNLPAIGIAVVLITGVRNRMRDLRALMPRVLQIVQTVRKGELAEVVGISR
jgi:hypothetical protein